MRYRLIKIGDKYAVERSYYGLFKRYVDFFHPSFWWSRNAEPHWPDMLTDDYERAASAFLKATHKKKNPFSAQQEVIEVAND